MAIARNAPTCPFCGKTIAKAVLKLRYPWQPPIFGDDFSHWEYKSHNCKEKKKWQKEHPSGLGEALNNIIKNHKNN